MRSGHGRHRAPWRGAARGGEAGGRGAGRPPGHGAAADPARIRQEIGGGPAYDTVHTILEHTYDKGLVPRDADGRRGACRPVRNAAEPTAQAMREAPWAGGRTRYPIGALRLSVTGPSGEEERAPRAPLAEGDV
nr:BlaI/MecI/CopY family transcriptional regulator [Streptomyces sp. NRRL S-31]